MTMRARRVRPVFLFALAAVAMMSCRDAAGPIGTGHFALVPSFTSAAAGIVEIARVRVRLFRLDETLALDETVTVPAGADSLALELTVTLHEPNEVFQMFLDFITPAGDTAFRAGPVEVTASSTSTEPVPIEVNAVYVGVGANAASVVITSTGAKLIPTQATQLSAEARDDQNQPIPGTPIAWASLDPARATVPDPAVGAIVGGTTPGPVLITATLLTGPADTVSVDVEPAPQLLVKRGGDGQRAPAGSELPLPLIVEVIGSDLPIEGATVQFTTGDGGSFSAASVVTDANGEAQTMWTLGPGLGAQTATATVSGFTSVSTTFNATAAAGITVSWNNASGGSWSDPANWTPNQVPGAADTVVIALDGDYTVALAANAAASVLDIGGATGNQTLALGANTLTLSGNSTIGVNGIVDMNGAVVDGAGILTVAGALRNSGGTSGLDAPYVNLGLMDVQAGTVEVRNGGSDTGSLNVVSGAGLTVTATGVLNLAGTSTLDGTLALQQGGGVVFGAGTHILGASSSVTGDGEFAVNGGTVSVLGAYSVSGSSTTITAGTVNFENTTTPATTTELFMSGGSLGGAGDVHVSAVMEWHGGTIGGGGQLLIQSTATALFHSVGPKILDAKALVNQGAGTWSMGNIDVQNGATITNAASGTLSVSAADGSVLDNTLGGPVTLTNDGTMTVTSDGFVSVNADVVNNGTLDIQTGALDLNGGFTHADGAVLRGTATLNLVDATVSALDGDVNPGTSPGVLGVTGALPLSTLSSVNLELNGTIAGSQYDQLNVSGLATLGGTLNITAGFTPQVGDQFRVLTFSSRGGSISAVNGLDLGGGIVLDTVWSSTDLRLIVPEPQIVFAGDSSGGLSTGIFTANSDGTNLARVRDLIPLGSQRQFPRWSPDRSRIAYSWDAGGGPLQLYVTGKTGASIQAVVTDTSTFRPRWNPDGVRLAFECGDGFSIVDVCAIGNVTGAIGTLPVNTYVYVTGGVPAAWQGGQSGFSWDPQNSDRLVFARDSTDVDDISMLWTANYDGTGVQRLAADGLKRPGDGAPLVVFGSLDYSPDGQQIAFAAYSPADATPEDKIFVINRDGTNLRQLTFLPGDDDSPLFSPDGSEVAFGRDRCVASGPYEGWVADITNIDGSLERQITSHGTVACDNLDLLGGDWSPDGSQIVLNGFDGSGNLLIYVVPRTVTSSTYLTDRKIAGRDFDLGGFVTDIQPSWRP
jgi:Tol biopolymer transport system component